MSRGWYIPEIFWLRDTSDTIPASEKLDFPQGVYGEKFCILQRAGVSETFMMTSRHFRVRNMMTST